MVSALEQWKRLFTAYGISHESIKSNSNAVSLTGLAGAPVFRAVESTGQLNELHTRARQKSQEMGRLLCLGLPLNHPGATVTLPGGIVLPSCRVYGGHIGSTFSLSGHRIEPSFLIDLKKEVLSVMSNGTNVKTPLLDWLQKLAGDSWVYGTPAGLTQLDSLLGLVARDTKLIGHVRTRQLSFGRGCADAMILPIDSLIFKNNGLSQNVAPADLRFIGMEAEMTYDRAPRQRIHAQFTDTYLTVLAGIDSDFAESVGCGAQMGASTLGNLTKNEQAVTQPAVQKTITVTPNAAMAGV